MIRTTRFFDDKCIYTHQLNHISIYFRYLLCTLPNGMENMKMYIFFTEKWRERGKNLFLYVILLNKDISSTVLDIVLQFCMPVFYTNLKGRVSHIFLFGP